MSLSGTSAKAAITTRNITRRTRDDPPELPPDILELWRDQFVLRAMSKRLDIHFEQLRSHLRAVLKEQKARQEATDATVTEAAQLER